MNYSHRNAVVAICLSAMLAACGGGGGGGNATATPESTPSSAPTPAPPLTPAPPPDPAPTDPPADPGADPDPAPPTDDYVLFESGHVRPLALSADKSTLYVVNTPDARLEILAVEPTGALRLEASVPVGMEPVAVAVAPDGNVWVVNHLSDSISIVQTGPGLPRVIATLQVGDEPRDIVFAGPDWRFAYVTTAYRGQNFPGFAIDDLKTPGLGRASVWTFDSADITPGRTLTPTAITQLFADTPRALATSPDGTRVYVAAFLSGNQTTALLNDSEVAAAKAAPTVNHEGESQPATGLIVGFNGGQWVDDAGTDWSHKVMFDLPDLDVFTLDASAPEPQLLASTAGVGTVLFNMAVNPVSGAVYVSNMDARNRIRFEGPGNTSSTVRGQAVDNRIAVITGDSVTNVDLNPHIDFTLHHDEFVPPRDKARSLAMPTDLTVTSDGTRLLVAAFSSNKIASIDTESLENGEYAPSRAHQVAVPGGGPSGVALLDDQTVAVMSRYANAVSTISFPTGEVISTIELFNPESGAIQRGRRVLYDAELTSSNGTMSCGSCHIFGDDDGLAWDLGNPDGDVIDNVNAFVPLRFPTQGVFHPMKGPMTTQTFRGIADSGPLHWRGDRSGQSREVVRGELESLEAAAFKEFNPAFVELVGREEELDAATLQDFTDFSLAIMYPPNAIRNLDNSLTRDQREGRRVYLNETTTGGALTCNHCHVLNPAENHFGTAGLMTNEGPGITEDFKVVHLRNVYTKVGMFGASEPRPNQELVHMGDQIRGFGLLHDGGIDTTSNFLSSSVFAFDTPAQREQVVDFVFAFDSNLAPMVGQQVTISADPSNEDSDRLDTMIARAEAGDCDLIAKGIIDDQARGALYRNGTFDIDETGADAVSVSALKNLAARAGQAITFTCVPPGSGERMGLDRNRDGSLDSDD